MKQTELPHCPTCGNAPEYAFKTDQFGWIRGGLKCPYNCHRVQLDCPAGNRERAEEKLAPQWIELAVANYSIIIYTFLTNIKRTCRLFCW